MSKEIFNPNLEQFPNSPIPNMEAYHSLVKEFETNYEKTWAKFANEKIDWFKPYDTILDKSNAPFYKWFIGGELNVAHQCIDRHLATKKIKQQLFLRGIMVINRY